MAHHPDHYDLEIIMIAEQCSLLKSIPTQVKNSYLLYRLKHGEK